MMGLDALESSAEGCVTHSYACPCREARMREIWEAAKDVAEAELEIYVLIQQLHTRRDRLTGATKRLRATLIDFKPETP